VVVHKEARDLYANFVDDSKLEVIPLGVTPDEFEFTERTETNSLVAIGSLRERKGYDVLLDALATVSETYPDVHLDVFGKGPQRETLEGLARDLGVASNVTFHGYVESDVLEEYLADARAFVHPSRSESFSLVRLEAMAVGCPMVVTNTDGAREMIREGEEGFVVEPERPDALADRITRLLSDVDLARDLGRGARERVEDKYDWADIARQYVDVYESVE
jgi:glycosyltransferase involved in cell wall biosynthesis